MYCSSVYRWWKDEFRPLLYSLHQENLIAHTQILCSFLWACSAHNWWSEEFSWISCKNQSYQTGNKAVCGKSSMDIGWRFQFLKWHISSNNHFYVFLCHKLYFMRYWYLLWMIILIMFWSHTPSGATVGIFIYFIVGQKICPFVIIPVWKCIFSKLF